MLLVNILPGKRCVQAPLYLQAIGSVRNWATEQAGLRTSRQPSKAADSESSDHNINHATQGDYHRRCRYKQLYSTILTRELMLKHQVSSIRRLPRLRKIEIHIRAEDVLSEPVVDKAQMLLYAAGLQHITNQRPVFIEHTPKNQRGAGCAAVKVTLTGEAAFDFLEKLFIVVMPKQVGFNGFKPGNITKQGTLSFRMPFMLEYPDFEDDFDTYEKLRAMHVSVIMDHVSDANMARTFWTGLGAPIMQQT